MRRLKEWSLTTALVGLLATNTFAWEAPASRLIPEPDAAEVLLTSYDPAYEVCDSSSSCQAGCGGCSNCCGSCMEIGGWISAGVFTNAHGAPDNGPMGFNQLTDFNLHQAWVYAEKAANTGGCGWDWGYRADFMFGIDADDTQAFGGLGWDNEWDTSNTYGFALPQLYGEVAYNDLSIKVGHFYTLIGWEVVPSPDNFFYSHAYTMYYGEPFTHTGFLASYAWSDDVTIYGGWTQGWDTGFDNTPDAGTFLGGISLPLTDRLSLTWACTMGSFGPATAEKAALGFADGDIYMNSFVFEWAINDCWTYILQHDLGVHTMANGDHGDWYGFNNYLQRSISDCLAVGVRLEWFHDEDGARVSHNGLAVGSYGGLTAGLNWSPRERLMVRPEIRYDWFDGTAAAGELPFDQGNETDQLSGGFDVVWTF